MRNVLPLLGILATPAGAETLHYTAYAAGLPVMTGELTWEPSDAGYHIRLGLRPAGITALLGPWLSTRDATGSFGPDDDPRPVRPVRYDAYSFHQARYRTIHIDYAAKGSMSGSTRLGARSGSFLSGGWGNEAVNPVQHAHTIDGMSVIAGLLHGADGGGGCGGTVRYSGTQEVSEISWHATGPEQLAPSSNSTFAGAAIRCDFVVRQLAGFRTGEDHAKAGQPMPGSVWLARIGGTLVPVRVALGPESVYGAFNACLDAPAPAP